MVLPTNHVNNDPGHTAAHNATNAAVNAKAPLPASGDVDGRVLAWSDDLQAFIDAAGKYVDPTDYLIDQANRSALDLASAHNDSVAGDNAILGLVGGATQWARDTQYAADALVGYGGLHVFKATPPSGNVLENLPPFGIGDGSAADRQLLLQRRVGFGAASIGGLNYDTITVTSTADYLSTDTPVSGTLRYAIEVTARAAGGGWIIFDKTTFANGAGATIKLKQDLCILTSNITIDGRGASVTITGGDGSYAEGGQPGLPAAVATTYSSSTAYSGTFAGPTLVTGVPTDTGSTYCCVDVTAKTQAQDGGLTPITSTRWRKVATAVTNGTVHYEQSARAVGSDGRTYALVKPIGGYTLSGTVKVSTTVCTVDPFTDRHDLNPVTGHWEPIGKIGFCFNIGFMQYSPGSGISAKLTFTDPTGANGIPARNIIVEKISKVDNWGGESNDTGSHRSFQVTGWQKDIWVDRVYVTNPCQWNDGLADVNCPTTNLTFSSCHFKQGHKAIFLSGHGIFASPAILLVSQVNPDLDAIYGATGSSPDAAYVSGGYAMWNDAANVVLKTNKLDKNGHVINWSTVTFPTNGAVEVGGSNPEQVLMLSVDHSDPNHDLVTLQTRPQPKKHLAAADASGVTFSPTHLNPVTSSDTSGKKTQLFILPHFLPGLTDDFPRFTDAFGVDWIDMRITYADCWFDELGDRGPHVDQDNAIVHLLNCYASDWGVYPDTLVDPTNTGLSYTFPCVPFSLVPTVPSSMQTSFNARMFVDTCAFEHAAGATGNAAKMISVAGAGAGYLKTVNLLDVPGDSSRDADALGGDFSAVSYSYTPRANTVVKARVKQSAGPVALWLYDHEASVIADGSISTAKLAANAVTSAKIDSSVATTAAAETFTNKRITKRVLSLSAGSATPAINTDSYDVVRITAQTAAITSFTTSLTGTPVSGDTLRISITDDGTARALTWGASFEASTVALPTTTVISARLDVGFFWNAATSKWRCVAVA